VDTLYRPQRGGRVPKVATKLGELEDASEMADREAEKRGIRRDRGKQNEKLHTPNSTKVEGGQQRKMRWQSGVAVY